MISGVTIPAGRYYLVMWIADLPFERFRIRFPPRVPLLIFVKEQGFEAIDFAIPCKVEVEVPNKNPDKTFSLTMAVAPKDAYKPRSLEAGGSFTMTFASIQISLTCGWHAPREAPSALGPNRIRRRWFRQLGHTLVILAG